MSEDQTRLNVVEAPEPAVENAEEAPEPRVLKPGELLVTLTTEYGEADVVVPPFNTWRSTARSALLSRGDDAAWAAITLSRDDAEAWIDLDPTKDEVDRFFEIWEKAGGGMTNRAERRKAGQRNLRAVS